MPPLNSLDADLSHDNIGQDSEQKAMQLQLTGARGWCLPCRRLHGRGSDPGEEVRCWRWWLWFLKAHLSGGRWQQDLGLIPLPCTWGIFGHVEHVFFIGLYKHKSSRRSSQRSECSCFPCQLMDRLPCHRWQPSTEISLTEGVLCHAVLLT